MIIVESSKITERKQDLWISKYYVAYACLCVQLTFCGPHSAFAVPNLYQLRKGPLFETQIT